MTWMKPKSVLFGVQELETSLYSLMPSPSTARAFPPLLLHSPMIKRESGILTKGVWPEHYGPGRVLQHAEVSVHRA